MRGNNRYMIRKSALLIFSFILFSNAAQAKDDIPSFDREAFIASASYTTELRIGMVDCVAMALKNNSDILVKKISPLIEQANVRTQKGRFDPVLRFDGMVEENFDISDTPALRPSPSKTRTGTFDIGIDQKWTTGTRTSFELNNTRTTSNTNRLFQSFQPAYDSEAQVVVVQPLLKGFGLTVNKADYLIAKNNKSKSDQELIRDVIKIITDVKKSYYELQYTQEQYRVARASLTRVEDLYGINKEKYAKGLASNIDVIESEAEVARYEQALIAAENVMRQAEDNLKFVTNLVDDPKFWNARILLLDQVSYDKTDFGLVKCILTAFDCRPDYQAAKFDLKNRDISVIYNRNGMLPTLDMVGSYGLNGLAQTFEKDMGHVGGGHYPDWTAGVSLRFPFFDDEAKGKYEKSKYEKAQMLIAFKRLEQRIILEVRDAWRDVDAKYRLLLASQKSKVSEEINYAAQETRFKAGLVSTLDIVIYQERLARAQVTYIKSVIDYNTAILELSKAQGTTLIEDNIRIE